LEPLLAGGLRGSSGRTPRRTRGERASATRGRRPSSPRRMAGVRPAWSVRRVHGLTSAAPTCCSRRELRGVAAVRLRQLPGVRSEKPAPRSRRARDRHPRSARTPPEGTRASKLASTAQPVRAWRRYRCASSPCTARASGPTSPSTSSPAGCSPGRSYPSWRRLHPPRLHVRGRHPRRRRAARTGRRLTRHEIVNMGGAQTTSLRAAEFLCPC